MEKRRIDLDIIWTVCSEKADDCVMNELLSLASPEPVPRHHHSSPHHWLCQHHGIMLWVGSWAGSEEEGSIDNSGSIHLGSKQQSSKVGHIE